MRSFSNKANPHSAACLQLSSSAHHESTNEEDDDPRFHNTAVELLNEMLVYTNISFDFLEMIINTSTLFQFSNSQKSTFSDHRNSP